jgi:hypothetical protein
MAATIYNYSYSDFYNSSVDCGLLHYEVLSSSISSANIIHIIAEDNAEECFVKFDGVLSSSDKDILDNIVAEHTGDEVTYIISMYSCVDTVSKTNSTKWSTRMAITPEFMVSGIYKIHFDMSFYSTKKKYCYFRIVIDDVESLLIREKPTSNLTAVFKNGCVFTNFNDGAHSIEIQVKSENSNNTVVVERSTLSVEAFNGG